MKGRVCGRVIALMLSAAMLTGNVYVPASAADYSAEIVSADGLSSRDHLFSGDTIKADMEDSAPVEETVSAARGDEQAADPENDKLTDDELCETEDNETAVGAAGDDFDAEGPDDSEDADDESDAEALDDESDVEDPDDDDTIDTWEALQKRINNAEAGEVISLDSDIEGDKNVKPLLIGEDAEIVLDLSGHVLNRAVTGMAGTKDGYAILNEGTLTIRDSSPDESGVITGGFSNTQTKPGRAHGIFNNGNLVLESGRLENTGKKGGNGCNVYVGEDSTFTMKGGSIEDNFESGVLIEGGSFTMTDGSICDGSVSGVEGGLKCVSVGADGEFTMSGGVVDGHSATAVDVAKGGSFTMTEGTVAGMGDAIVSVAGLEAVFEMTGGEIEGEGAAGVSVGKDGTFELSGGTYKGNCETGVSADGANAVFEMTGGNLAGEGSNSVSVRNGGSFTMTDGTFTVNGDTGVSIEDGGSFALEESKIAVDGDSSTGVLIGEGGSFEMTGSTITVNGEDAVGVNITEGVELSIEGNTFIVNGEACTGISLAEDGSLIMAGLTIDGAGGKGVLVEDGSAEMENCHVTGSGDTGVDITGGSLVMTGCTVTGKLNQGVAVEGGEVTMTGCTLPGDGEEDDFNTGVYVGDGSLEMTESTFSGNWDPGVFMTGGTVTMEECTITGDGDTGVQIEDGSLTMNGGGIDGEWESADVYIDEDGSFTMNGAAISGNGDTGVWISGGTFTMEDGIITEMETAGVSVGGGEFIMEGGSVSGNADEGVNVADGVFTMNGGAVSGNGGTAVSLYKSDFTLSGGEIAQNEDGVYVSRNSTFRMEGGDIADNRGDGITIIGGDAELEDGLVTGNKGYGAKLHEGSILMTGGKITGSGQYGIWLEGYSDFKMTGGEIRENRGGVYVGVDDNVEGFRMCGNPVITDNFVGEGEDAVRCNVNLQEGKIIELDSKLDASALIGVSMEVPGIFTDRFGNLGGGDPKEFFYSDDRNRGIALENGEAVLRTDMLEASYIERSWDGSKVTEETKTQPNVTLLSKGQTDIGGGWYMVNGDVKLYDKLVITGDTQLILGDDSTLFAPIISIRGGGTLKIYGQKDDSGLITTSASRDCGIYFEESGRLEIHGGNINAHGAGNRASGIGCSPYVDSDSSIAVYGGKVFADADKTDGICLNNKSDFTVYGGEVTACGTEPGSGILIYGSGGSINILGGKVTAEGQGGVRVGLGAPTVNIAGGIIKAKGAPDGTGIWGKSINISGGSITATGATGIGDEMYSESRITLGYTKDTASSISIKADSFNGQVTLEQGFRNENGTFEAGEVSDNSMLSGSALVSLDGQMADTDKPEFSGHALRLDGQICLQFLLKLPDGEKPEDYPDSFVTFEGNKIDSGRQYPMPEETFQTSGRYMFQADLSSIQMADKITPIFHYVKNGVDRAVAGEPYAVTDYIDWGLGEGAEGLSPQMTEILRKLADYGHYAQPYLSERNGWTIGTDYAEMKLYETDSYDYDAVKEAAKESASTITRDSGDIKKASYSLIMDSKLTLAISIYPQEGKTFDTVTVDGEAVPVTLNKNGFYTVRIPGIYASRLADSHTITVGDCTMTLSALSYVYDWLNSGKASNKMSDLLCALYNYAQVCSRS